MTTVKPGFVYDLDEATYHADRDSLSHSGVKLLLRSPALFRHEQDSAPVYKAVFDFGSAAHKQALGAGPELVVHEYDPEKVKSPKATNAWKDQQKEVRAFGGVLLLPDEMAVVEAMAARLSSHRLAMRLLADGQPEVSAYAVDESTGIMRRCRFDWLGPTVLTDYKSAATADPRDLAGRYGVVKKLGYGNQAAWYLDLARDLGHPAAAFAFIFQEKTEPYQVTVAYVDDADLDEARDQNRIALERFRDCRDSGIWPEYLPDDTAARLSLTNQTYEEERVA